MREFHPVIRKWTKTFCQLRKRNHRGTCYKRILAKMFCLPWCDAIVKKIFRREYKKETFKLSTSLMTLQI